MKQLFFLSAILLVAYTGSAQNFKMATSEPLHSTQQELKVKGRNGIMIKQKLTFGDYYTTKVKRSAIRKWSTASGFSRVWTEHTEGRQSVTFYLTDDKHSSEVHCISRVKSDDLVIGRNPDRFPNQVSSILRIGTDENENNFSVAIYTDSTETPWELFLNNNDAQYRRERYIGYVDRGNDYYTIAPVWQAEKKSGHVVDLPFGSLGFEIRNSNGEARAAVSLMNNGVVYMGQLDDNEKFLMANICAALLLQTDISQ